MAGFVKHRVASGVIAGLALLIGLAPAASAATISDSDRYAAVDKAVAYLINNQAADGSLTSGIDDSGEWAAIALAAAGKQLDEVTNGGDSLLQYFISTKDIDLTPDGAAYHLEQRILALHAGGYSTASFENVDYNDLLLGQYTNGKISTSDTTYDDIFGIMAIVATNSSDLTAYLQSATNNLASYQQGDGGYCSNVGCPWGEDIDSTAMAYAALAVARDEGITTVNGTTVNTVMDSARQYIFSSEVDNMFGSYGPNYSTTSLVALALNMAGEDTQPMVTAILAGQDTNGGIKYDSDPTDPYGGPSVYNTDFAVLALLGTNWLLNPTPIARPVTGGQGGGETTSAPIVEPAAVVETHPIIRYVATGPATPAPISQPETADTTTTDQSTETPTGTVAETQKEAAKSNTLKYIGYGLIVIAVLGLGFYIAASRQKE